MVVSTQPARWLKNRGIGQRICGTCITKAMEKMQNKILEKCRKAACIFAHGSKQAPSAGGSKQAVVIPGSFVIRLRLLLRLSSLHRMLLITLHKTQWHGGNQKKCIRLWQLMAPTKKFTDARLDLAKASLQYCLMEEILHQICKISHYLQGFIHPRKVQDF